ncbi:ensconsin isoform X35 [Procambarus clarkii]|uniref:ensconsin isoform X35 n=1 Tax=Procambarus clarkii TaxID=6728 RepID=UPI003743CAAB
MSRSASVSVPRRELYVVPERRASLELEDAPRHLHLDQPREFESWPCDSFFLLPDAVLAMDAGAFRADLMSLDPALSASLPDWDLPGLTGRSASPSQELAHHTHSQGSHLAHHRPDRRSLTLLDHHLGLTVHTAGHGTVLIGGGGDGRESSGGAGAGAASANGHSSQQSQQPQQQQPQQQQQEHQSQSAATKRSPAQKDDKSSGLSYKDREERLRQLRERQQLEKQQKLEELKEQAAAAQRFREQQENERRRRLEEMRLRDADRRSQVEERKRIIQQAEQDRREAVIRKNAEREHRLESKRRNERSNIVFAFGSSTPRMLDPKDNSTNASYWSSRRATSTTNVHLVDASITRRASECSDMDLSRKRATSAQSLDRKPEGEDLMTRSMTAAIPASAARRRTDLIPAMPSLRDSTGANRSSPRHRSPVSVGATPSTTKPLRAKSAGSDRSTPATPARTPVKTSTPKKTPSQVKAESAAKKAIEKSKTTPKSKPSPKTPLQSPAVENKSLPGVKEDKKKAKEDKNLEIKSDELNDITEDSNINESVGETPPREKMNGADLQLEAVVADVQVQPEKDAGAKIEHPSEDLQAQDKSPVAAPVSETKQLIEDSVKSVEPSIKEKEVLEVSADTPSIPVEDKNVVDESPDKVLPEENLSSSVIEESLDKPVEDNSGDQDKTLAQKAAEKPVTGYATEEEYKAALAEKRRLAREAKERELELERQRQLEEEERERKEEEEFLKMIAEQKKAEEERLRKAIEEADRNRIEEAKRKEEEEKQREEAERLENQKRLETEERLRREEEERQARKSRVAAIMARTRGKGGSNTPTKAEAKTPSDEAKNFGDGEMTTSMTDSMISLVTASEMQSEPKIDSQPVISTPDTPAQLISDVASHHSSDVLPKPSGDSYAPPTSDVSIKTVHDVDMASQSHTTEIVVDSKSSVEQKVMHSNIEVTSTTENYQVDDLISGMSSVKVEEPHVNGDSPVPMDTTPTQSVDLLGSLSDVHSVNHNGVDNTPPHTTQGTDNLLGSLDPLDSSLMSTTTITPAASNFEQIIDLGQTKLSNEDAVNSNPPSPFIAFEQNLNKKQNQENTSTVPDLLL